MLKAAIATPDYDLAAALEHLIAQTGFVRCYKTVRRLLQPYELVRLANADETDLLFLDFVDPDAVPLNEEAAGTLNRWTGVVGFSSGRPESASNPLPGLLQGWLQFPVSESEFLAEVHQVMSIVRERTHERLYAVMPAKAGSGASTTALHLARALAGVTSQDVLLMDADLRSGILATLLNRKPGRGTQQALALAGELTPTAWNAIVERLDRLSLLGVSPTGAPTTPLPHWSQYYKLLQFARRNYAAIVVDLPEVINEATVEVVRSAESVLVVSSSELAALTLAAQRCAELDRWGVRPHQVAIVLNRWERCGLSVEEVESMLERRVIATIPNNYRLLQGAAVEGGFVASDSELGRAYRRLAQLVLGAETEPQSVFASAGHGRLRKGIRAWFG